MGMFLIGAAYGFIVGKLLKHYSKAARENFLVYLSYFLIFGMIPWVFFLLMFYRQK